MITRNGSYPNILEAKSSSALIRHKPDAPAGTAPTATSTATGDAAAALPPPLRGPAPAAAQLPARPPSSQRLIAARRPSLPSRYPPPPQQPPTQQQQPQQSPGPPESQHLWPQFPGCVPYPHWYVLQLAIPFYLSWAHCSESGSKRYLILSIKVKCNCRPLSADFYKFFA